MNNYNKTPLPLNCDKKHDSEFKFSKLKINAVTQPNKKILRYPRSRSEGNKACRPAK